MNPPICICAAMPHEVHLPACPLRHCACPNPERRHSQWCQALRVVDFDVEGVVYDLTDTLAQVDAMLAKNAKGRLLMRELRVSLLLHEAKRRRPEEPKVRP